VTCDGEGLPLNIELSPGQRHETQLFEELWNTTEVSDQTLRHLVQPEALAGDKAYRSAAIVDQLASEGVQPVIPEKGTKANDEDHPDFDRDLYRRRNVVERLIGRLKECRRIFGRFEKTAVNYLGMTHVACIRIYLTELV
jgi:transposase